MRLRHAFFSLFVVTTLLSPLFLYGLVNICKVEVPSEYTAQSAAWLTGGVSEVRFRDYLSLESFEQGSLQEAAEKTVGNYIPAKAFVLLKSAEVQRAGIAASNMFFGWECYPTFYGSSQLYLPAYNALAEMPMYNGTRVLARGEFEAGLKEFGMGLAAIADRLPDRSFCVFVTDRTATSLANPALSLVSKSLCTEDCVKILREQTANCPNVSIFSKAYCKTDEYYERYYPTDHHWNGFGAMAAADLCPIISREESAHEESSIDFGQLCFNGTLSRRGLFCPNRSPIVEPKLDLRGVNVGDASAEYAKYLLDPDGCNQLVQRGLRAEFNFYGEWYGGDRSMEIANERGGENEALLISDSYGDAFRWLLAERYGKTHCLIDLKKSEYTVSDFESWVSEYDCEDVFIVGWAGNYTHMRVV